MNSDLQVALDNLKNDRIVLRLAETSEGDNYFVVYSKHWKTKFGAPQEQGCTLFLVFSAELCGSRV